MIAVLNSLRNHTVSAVKLVNNVLVRRTFSTKENGQTASGFVKKYEEAFNEQMNEMTGRINKKVDTAKQIIETEVKEQIQKHGKTIEDKITKNSEQIDKHDIALKNNTGKINELEQKVTVTTGKVTVLGVLAAAVSASVNYWFRNSNKIKELETAIGTYQSQQFDNLKEISELKNQVSILNQLKLGENEADINKRNKEIEIKKRELNLAGKQIEYNSTIPKPFSTRRTDMRKQMNNLRREMEILLDCMKDAKKPAAACFDIEKSVKEDLNEAPPITVNRM